LVSTSQNAVNAWQRFWFREIPPHIYALLRILFGLLGLVGLLEFRDLSTYWMLDGLAPSPDTGFKAWLAAHALGAVVGRALFFGAIASFVSMSIGFRTDAAVVLSLASSLAQVLWNPFPLSAAHAVVQVILFLLVWSDSGAVWSVDAWLDRRRRPRNAELDSAWPVIAPLRLIRFQVALICLTS